MSDDTNNVVDEPTGGDAIVTIDNVSVVFNIANERIQSLKEYFIKMMKRELMFREFIAVDNVSFTVNRGDVFGLVGTNGSGKSTMLKVIAGVLEPSKGTRTVEGTISPLIELGAGFDMELTARENIYLNGALLGHSKKFLDEHIDEVIEFAELANFMEMPIKNYSSGMVARIAFAIATITAPDLLIVDEVLSVGDFLFQQKCERKINSMIERGTTVLIVSHSTEQIERMCNRVLWIEKGHLKMVGPARQVCAAYRKHGATQVSRLFGSTPHESSISISEEAFRKSRYAVLLSDRLYTEAMGVIGFAGAIEAPLLLSEGSVLTPVVRNELERLNVKEVFLVGGRSAFGVSVERELEEMGLTYAYVEGETFQEISLSSMKLIQEFNGNHEGFCMVGSLSDPQAVLSLGPIAYKYGSPILFVDHSDKEDLGAPCFGLSEFELPEFNRVLVAGGTNTLPENSFPGATPESRIVRFDGETRYDISNQAAHWSVESKNHHGHDVLNPNTVIIGCGIPGYCEADLIAASALAAKENGPILLTNLNENFDTRSLVTITDTDSCGKEAFLSKYGAQSTKLESDRVTRKAFAIGGYAVLPGEIDDACTKLVGA